MTENMKDWVQYGTAVGMVATGCVLSVMSFVTLHAVHHTVLAFVGEAISFAGAVFGISLYARSKLRHPENASPERKDKRTRETENRDEKD